MEPPFPQVNTASPPAQPAPYTTQSPQQPYPQQPYGQGPYPAQPYAAPGPYGQTPYAAPYPYPPQPVAYAPPPVPGKQTFEGLGRMKTATMLALVVGVVGVLLGLVVISMMGSMQTGDVLALGGALIILGVFAAIILIVGLIALILAVMGIYTFHQGRMEFGADHAASAKKGVNFIIFAIVTQLVGTVGASIFTFGAVFTLNPDLNALRTGMLLSAAVGGAVTVVAVALYGLGMQFLIERLMTAKGRGMRMMFLATGIGGAVLSLVLGIVSVLMFNPLALGQAQGLAPLASIVSVISLYIYWMQLKEAEAGARTMIQTGQFNPDGAAVPVAAVAPAPVAPPPM